MKKSSIFFVVCILLLFPGVIANNALEKVDSWEKIPNGVLMLVGNPGECYRHCRIRGLFSMICYEKRRDC
jgi:hypothetical protein